MQATFPGHTQYGGFDHDEELAGADGMHMHFWVPKGTPREAIRRAAAIASGQRDLVRYSWDYIPEGHDASVQRNESRSSDSDVREDTRGATEGGGGANVLAAEGGGSADRVHHTVCGVPGAEGYRMQECGMA